MTSALRMLPHVLAGLLALTYAWAIEHTRYVTTGVQFVAPLAVILMVHLGWLFASRPQEAGISKLVLRRSLGTAMGLVALTVFLAAVTPLPAEASAGLVDIFGSILGVLACLATLAVVVGAAAVVLYASWLLIARLFRLFSKRPPGAGESRLFDAGAISVALLAIGAASLEGVPGGFSFATLDHASTTYEVAASPERVWQQVGTATSPDFPLPVLFQSIPRPVAVLVDEGAALGARRIVRFTGRQGTGDLVLQVVARTTGEAVFQAVSDGSPIAHWVHHKALTFRVEPAGSGSRLTVSLDYDRRLSPAWFFGPYIRLASYLAVDVLARDTKLRAEKR